MDNGLNKALILLVLLFWLWEVFLENMYLINVQLRIGQVK